MVGRGGEGDLGYLTHLIFSGKSGSTIIFGGFNNLRIKSYISPCKSYEGCKNRCVGEGRGQHDLGGELFNLIFFVNLA